MNTRTRIAASAYAGQALALTFGFSSLGETGSTKGTAAQYCIGRAYGIADALLESIIPIDDDACHIICQLLATGISAVAPTNAIVSDVTNVLKLLHDTGGTTRGLN